MLFDERWTTGRIGGTQTMQVYQRFPPPLPFPPVQKIYPSFLFNFPFILQRCVARYPFLHPSHNNQRLSWELLLFVLKKLSEDGFHTHFLYPSIIDLWHRGRCHRFDSRSYHRSYRLPTRREGFGMVRRQLAMVRWCFESRHECSIHLW